MGHALVDRALDGAVIDEPFNTVDVFMVMPVASISARYLGRFGVVA